MNSFEISPGSLESVVRHTIEADKQIRLYQKKFLNFIPNVPLKIRFISKAKIRVDAQVETLFGKDIVKVLQKSSDTIKKNLEEYSGIQVNRILLSVKDVFNETANNKDN